MGVLDFLYSRFKADADEIRREIRNQGEITRAQISAAITRLTALEEKVTQVAKNQADMDAILQTISDTVSKLGTDLQAVFAFIKANPGVDLTAQVAQGQAIADALAQVDADALAQENPIPVPPTP